MKKWLKQPIGSGFLLVAASFTANFLNFVFNAFLGRHLTFSDFGFLTLINTFNYLLSVPLAALAITVNHRIAYLFAKNETNVEVNFYQQINKRLLYIAVFISVIWMGCTPLLAKFFQVHEFSVLMLFTPAIYFGIVASLNNGFLRGRLMFTFLALAVLTEAVTKLIAAAFFVVLGINHLIYLSIPLSVVAGSLLSIYFAKRALPTKIKIFHDPFRFPRRFFLAALVSGLSTILFFTLDVILAKHYLSPVVAGQYALLSLIGKMIYFFGAMPNQFTLTLISREEGLNHNPSRMFHKIFFATLIMVLISVVSLGIFGNFTIVLLFGKKTIAILPFVLPYIFGIALITLASTLTSYHLARKNLIFSYASLLVTAFMALLIFFDHKNLASFADAIYLAGIFNFVFFVFIHFFQKNGIYILRNFVDLVDAFHPKGKHETIGAGKKRILILNWRDTHHVWAGGAEVYIQELAKRWVQMGHEVLIFSGNDGKNPRDEVIDGVHIKRRGGFYFVYVWAFLYYLLQFRKKFDLVIDSQNGMPFFTPLYVKEPIVALLHHVHQNVFRKSLRWPFSEIARVIEKRAMPFWYRHIPFITVSESSKNDLRKIYPEAKITIVNPGVDLKHLTPGEKAKFPLVLYLGRLKAYKSIETLIQAFKIVAQKNPKARLTIAGEGEEKSHLQHLAFKLELSDKITFVGKVNEKEKVGLLQQAWVFVNPSIMEGWGITTIEANACGTPVVAADVPGLRDSVQNPESGYLVPHENIDQFAEKIGIILSNYLIREKMSRQAVEWAKQFDWHKSAIKCEKILFNK